MYTNAHAHSNKCNEFNHNVCDNNTYYLQITCERDGAKLVEIESKKENEFLKSFLSKLLGDKVLQSGKDFFHLFLSLFSSH